MGVIGSHFDLTSGRPGTQAKLRCQRKIAKQALRMMRRVAIILVVGIPNRCVLSETVRRRFKSCSFGAEEKRCILGSSHETNLCRIFIGG